VIDLQASLQQRFPTWFAGARRRVSIPAVRGLARLSGIDAINAFLRSSAHLRGMAFVDAALGFLDCRYTVDHIERERIPETGRVVIVANHPMGAIDALALLRLVGDVRPDVRILANDFLEMLGGLSDLLIPLRVLGGKPSSESLRAVDTALEREEAVIVFPAGEVSRLTPRGVRDTPWRRGFLKFAERANAPVLPVRITGRNSALFYGLSALYKPLGTALLPREMFARRQRRIEVRIGEAASARELVRDSGGYSRAMEQVRERVAAIGTRRETRPARQALAHTPRVREIMAELATLERIGYTDDGMHIHVGRLRSDTALMREIARLREVTFRAVGEGTGKRHDIDKYDTWYQHILVWDAQACQVAGAYRAALGAEVMQAHGESGLYTHSLFDYSPEFANLVEHGMELGRSFVQPRYWGTRSLEYLWYGIGAHLRRYPHVRYLFGPVSISAALPLEAREQLVGYYSKYFGDEVSLARSRNPFRFSREAPQFGALDAEDAFRMLKKSLSSLGARVPTLYKQYTDLCEPGGARFLAFGVDPDFEGCIDGLIVIDLSKIKPKKFARYLSTEADMTALVP
jgi:putative hemolysin